MWYLRCEATLRLITMATAAIIICRAALCSCLLLLLVHAFAMP